ncbi:MAG: hypothetical protein ACWA5L_04080 [bacterium]
MVKLRETIKPATNTLRKGWLAYLGVYGTAYDQILPHLENAAANTSDIFSMLVLKGENLEATAQETMGELRETATKRYTKRAEQVRKLMPFGTNDNDRVAELEDEIAALNKKITSLKKKATPAKKTTKKAVSTKKTSKKRAKKAA